MPYPNHKHHHINVNKLQILLHDILLKGNLCSSYTGGCFWWWKCDPAVDVERKYQVLTYDDDDIHIDVNDHNEVPNIYNVFFSDMPSESTVMYLTRALILKLRSTQESSNKLKNSINAVENILDLKTLKLSYSKTCKNWLCKAVFVSAPKFCSENSKFFWNYI